MPVDFAVSLGLTLILEGAVALAWGIRGRDLLLFALANVLTNPPAVLIHKLFPCWGVTAVLEIGVVGVEGLCYARLGGFVRKPWIFSLTANAFSFCVGLLIDMAW